MMIIILLIIILTAVLFIADFSQKKISWGVTFSQQYAKDELGLDWKKTYLAILDDLKIDHIRLSAYWNYNEPLPKEYNFADLDWQINEASQRKVKIILAVGQKLPRWPECHYPKWTINLDDSQKGEALLQFINLVVNRYKDQKNITTWQVENEPFLKLFGECPPLDKNLLNREIELVKKLSDKPIMITDSGELSAWTAAAKTKTNILGTTLYRVVYNKTFGYFRWPLPASYYYIKSQIIKFFFKKERVIVAELQAESWHKENKNLSQMTLAEYFQSMSLNQFKSNIKFAQKAGFDEIYLWGAEWWYFMKENKNYHGYWNEAKKLW